LDDLAELTRKATRFLDNVVTVNSFPIQDVKDAVGATRKIGLGVMGWHDALIKLGIAYDSAQALELADQVMGLINQVAKETSMELAQVRTEPVAGQRRSILGSPSERTDFRTVQVLFSIADPPPFVRPGLMLEVDIDGGAGSDH
jgi:ribonucleotide reductase alpha subunit